MKRRITRICAVLLGVMPFFALAQTAPELMYFKFDGTGATVLNEATSPVVPSGTFVGSMSQGGNGQFNGGLVGNGDLTNNSRFGTNWRTQLTGSWTISLYVSNLANQGFNQVYLLGASNNTGDNIRVYTNSFTISSITVASTVSGFTNITMPAAVGQTFTMHIVHDAAAQQIRLYKNGVLTSTGPAPANFAISAPVGSQMIVGGHIQSATIGRNINTGTLIDEFRLYNRALSPSEIALTYNQELPLAADCPFSSNFTVTPAGVSAIVNWVPGSSNTNYHFEYGAPGFALGTGTALTGALGGTVPPLNVTGLSPTTTYAYYFYERCNNGADTSFVSTGTFTTLVACPPPTNFAFGAPTGNSINFSWTSLGNDFDVEYGISGFSQGNGTGISFTGNQGTITGLTPNTSYTVYLRQNCSGASLGNSTWTGPFTISTTCAIFGLPYEEDFESAGWVVGVNAAHTGSAIDNCWNRSPAGTGYFWGAKSLPTVTKFSGPNAAFSGDNYIFAVANNGAAGAEAFIASPLIDLSGTTNPELQFFYHMYGSQMGSLTVQVNNGGSWVDLTTISGQQQSGEFEPWRARQVSLAAYAGDTIQIRYKAVRGSGINGDIAIDAMRVIDQGTCAAPPHIMALGQQFNEFHVGWKNTGATQYQIEYGPSNFFQSTGITSITVTDTFLTVTPPLLNGCYTFRVRSVCGGVPGIWSGTFDICLNCIYTAPFLENFNGPQWVTGTFFNNNGSQIDSCWQRTPIWQGANVFFWGTRTGTTSTGSTGPNGDNSPGGSGKYIFAVGYGTGGDQAFFTSPYIDMQSLNRPTFRYFYHLAGGQIGSVRTEIQRIGETTWTQVDEIVGAQQTATADPWLPREVPIFGYAGDTVRIRLVAVRGAGAFNTGDHAIDDFEIYEDSACAVPGTPSAFNITATGAGITWTTQDAQSYRVLYSESPFDPATSSIVNSVNDTVFLTGLNPESSYTVYVLAICGGNLLSDTSQILNFNTGCLPVYIAPYVPNLENNVWVSGTGSGNVNSVISPCWSRTQNGTNYRWGPKEGPSQSTLFPFTGPLGANTGTKYLLARGSSGSVAGDFATITSPMVDVSGLNLPTIEFYYHMHGADIGKLLIQVNDGSGWQTADSIVGFQQLTQADSWLQRTVELPFLTNDTIQVRFYSTWGGLYSDIAIDDIRIDEGPACPAPFNLQANVLNPYQVQVNWGSVNPVNLELVYGVEGFIPNSFAATLVPVTGTSFLLDSVLNPGQCYDIYIRNNCNANNDSVSNWIGPVTFCIPQDYDLSAQTIYAPGATCGASAQPISLIVRNNGFYSESNFDLGATVFVGGTQVTTLSTTFTGTLQSGQVDTIAIGTINTSAGGDFFVRAWTDLAADVFRFNDTISRLIRTVDINPMQVTVMPDTLCGPGTTMLIKNPAFAADVQWFDNNNNLLATGDTFSTGTIGADTSFIARGLVTNGLVGPPNNAFGNNTGFFTTFDSVALAFTANKWMVIDSVTVYPDGPGVINVVLRTNPGDSIVNNRFIVVPAGFAGGAYRAYLNMPVVPGSYHLGVDTTATTVAGLGRTSTNTQYPYSFGTDVIITGNNLGETSIYYFFYNWRISVGDVCTRPDATVNVYVRDLPVAAFSANTSAGPTLTGYDVVFDATATTGGTTYNWNFGDGNTGTGITPTHTYQSNGTFTVTLIVSSLCGADTITQTVTIAGINIDEWSRENELRLYPNPTQNEVSVEFFLEGSQQVEIVLINQIGEVLQQNSLRLDGGKQQHLLQLGHLPSGVYLVKLSFNGNIVVKRVTKI